MTQRWRQPYDQTSPAYLETVRRHRIEDDLYLRAPIDPNGSSAWRDRAACRELDTSLFFIERGENVPRVAREACERCPVIAECRRYILAQPDTTMGYWAGTSSRERRRLRQERNGR